MALAWPGPSVPAIWSERSPRIVARSLSSRKSRAYARRGRARKVLRSSIGVRQHRIGERCMTDWQWHTARRQRAQSKEKVHCQKTRGLIKASTNGCQFVRVFSLGSCGTVGRGALDARRVPHWHRTGSWAQGGPVFASSAHAGCSR